jgi:hypothetical protein
MGRTAAQRIVFDIFLVISLLLMPWWATLGVAFILLLYFPSFYEILFVGVFLDILYHPARLVFPQSFLASIVCFFSLIIATTLRTRIAIDGSTH